MIKQRFIKAALAAVVLALAFAGCENVQQVEGDVSISPQTPSKVKEDSITITKTASNKYYIVSWTASSSENVSYKLYIQQKDKKSNRELEPENGPTNRRAFDPINGAQIANADQDQWYARLDSDKISNCVSAAGTYKLGIATGYNSGVKVGAANSEIVWVVDDKDLVFNAIPHVAAAVTLSTDRTKLILEWDGQTETNPNKQTVNYWWPYADFGNETWRPAAYLNGNAIEIVPFGWSPYTGWNQLQVQTEATQGYIVDDDGTAVPSTAGKWYAILQKYNSDHFNEGEVYTLGVQTNLMKDDASYLRDQATYATIAIPAP